jgi:hypothetical protein
VSFYFIIMSDKLVTHTYQNKGNAMSSVKETQDVIQLIRVLAKAISDAKADGHINILDMPKVAPVVVALKVAVDGSDKIKAEIKAASVDLTTLTTLLSDSVTAMLALVDAVVKK